MTKAKTKARSNGKHPGGRPPNYTKELGERICRAVSCSTDSLKKICANNPGFPNRETIWQWRLDHVEFGHLYDSARRLQADLLAEEITEIADNSNNDTLIKIKSDGSETEVANTEWIARSRLRVDTRKWIACKLLPKVYGEKIQNETTVTLKHEDMLKELE